MKVLTKALIQKSEENAVNNGIFSFSELMFNAGSKATEIILQKYDCKNKKIAVICGSGNNGGDGFVIAKNLNSFGADVTVVTPLGMPCTENAKFYFNKLNCCEITDNLFKNSENFDIVIDALFGIGLNRKLDENCINLINKINQLNAVRISVDIPSGVSADSGKFMGGAINADLTVTFIALKPCFLLPPGSDYCGEVVVADIGVEPFGFEYLTLEKPIFEKRRHNSHKGSFGTALLFCGSYGMAGAAILSARSALRSGVGIAKCVLTDGIYQAFTSAVPEAVCVPVKQNMYGTLSQNELNIEELTSKCNAILFGCGVGNNSDVFDLLKNILLNTTVPTVIDADGINALCNGIDILKKIKAPIILTPHPGEMARLCNVSVAETENNRIEVSRNFAIKHNVTVVLKGANTIIAGPNGQIYFNTTGNPGMATGGSGDVLAGIIVSLLAQGLPVDKAVAYAVYLHGEAGDKAELKKGQRAMLPSDMIDEL